MTSSEEDDPDKAIHSSLEVNYGNSGEELEVPLCPAQTRYVRPRAALNSNLQWRLAVKSLFLAALNLPLVSINTSELLELHIVMLGQFCTIAMFYK